MNQTYISPAGNNESRLSVRSALLRTAILALAFATALTPARAQDSPIDRSSPLQKISGEFGLADGAAWDGNWGLYIPDVKGQKLYRYTPKTKQLSVVMKDAGRISATFFQHGRLYLSDNGNQSISVFQKGKKKLVFDFKKVDSKLRPNDLVLDNEGGMYVTFTPQNQVLYIDASGKHHVAVKDINTPNGITLSPDGKTLYVSSFVPKEIWKYKLAKPGVTEAGTRFATLPESKDRGADGMAIDRAENVYCTGPTGVTIWNPQGKLLDRIETPSKPINCIFGDQDMCSLYISCFDGLYLQKVRIAGKSPQPPIDGDTTVQNNNRPSTIVPESIQAQLDEVYTSYGSRKLLMDLFSPKGAKNAPAVIVVHGGGWLKGDKTKFRALAIRLAEKGFVTAAIEYRLGTEAKFPAAIHDCFAAVRYLKSNAKRLGIDPDRIGAVGGSAGGHLVGLMAAGSKNRELTGRQNSEEPSESIRAAIVLAGPMQIASGSVAERSRKVPGSNANIWIGKTIDEAPDQYRLADAYEKLDASTPPLLFMAGELDNPERNAPSRQKLKSAGVWTDIKVYTNGKHGCWNQLPWFDAMSDDMALFFEKHLGSDK